MKSRKLSHVHTFTAPTTNTTKLTKQSETYQKTDLPLIIYRGPTKIAQRKSHNEYYKQGEYLRYEYQISKGQSPKSH